MSKYTDEIDGNYAICPYCGDEWQIESEDYDEEEREIECAECGNRYWLSQDFSVDHCTRPDCELNGEDHKPEQRSLVDGRTHSFCSVCDKCL